jgi:hypothetical protein
MRSRVRVVVVVLIALVVNACKSDSVFGPGSRSDLNEVINELQLVKSYYHISWSRQFNATVPYIIPEQCTYAASAQRFNCPTQTIGGVTVTQSYTLLSKSGAPQDAFDGGRTAAVQTNTTLSGTYTINGSDLVVDGHDSYTLSGLLTGKHTVNATSTQHVSGTFVTAILFGGEKIQTTLSSTTASTVSELVLPPSFSDVTVSSIPMSGTITVHSTTSVDGKPAVVSSAVFPFDGTFNMVALITVDGVTHPCPLHMFGLTYSTCL